MNFEWETISYGTIGRTYRAKVFGGWIVNNFTIKDNNTSESMVFIPDPKHKWII